MVSESEEEKKKRKSQDVKREQAAVEKKPEFSPDIEAARARTAGATTDQLEAQRAGEGVEALIFQEFQEEIKHDKKHRHKEQKQQQDY